MLEWHTEQRAIKELTPAEYNPRKLTDKQRGDLEKSIKKFNLVEIPAINLDNTLLAGHQRVALMVDLGRGDEVIDVRVPNRQLTDEEAKEYNLRSNKNTGEWDMDKLFAMPKGLLEEVGFDNKEIQKLIDTHTEAVEDDYDIEEGLKQPCNVVKGDIWQLGSHRVMCGDSTSKEDVEKLMDGKKADMVFTDPPYSVNYEKKQKEILGKDGYNHIENDALSVKDISENVWRPTFANMYEVARDECSFYLTMPQGGDQMMMMMMMSERWQVKHELIWVKPSPVFSMGRLDYDYKHEPIAYGWKKSHNFYGQGEFVKSVWEIGRDSDGSHPTMKPISLIENALKNSSKNKDIVLDLFLGSGSTLIACEQTGRICYGMEIDELYTGVVIDRWCKLTGCYDITKNGKPYRWEPKTADVS